MTAIPTLYHYDPVTGALLSSGRARKDPKSGKPLIPKHATKEEPPTAGEAEVVIREEGGWSVEEDHRGETLYSTDTGESVTIEEIGPLPDGLTETARPSAHHHWDESAGAWTLDLEAYRNSRLAALADYRWQVETGGLSWDGHTIPTDDRSKTMINAGADRARRSGSAPSAGWKISADTWIDATVQQMEDLQEAVETFVDACFAREKELAQDILDAENEDDLDAVDIESGWPADSVLAGGGS